MLEHLDRANLFLIPLDSTRRWYRYHHLFAEVLGTHLLEGRREEGQLAVSVGAGAIVVDLD